MLPRMLRPARAYVCAQCRLNAISRPQTRHVTAAAREAKTKQDEKFVRKRIADLGGKDKLSMLYPRWEQPPDHGVMNAAAFFEQWSPQTAVFSRGYVSRNETVVVYGRVTSRRKQGSRLYFIDLESGQGKVQVVIKRQELEGSPNKITPTQYQEDTKNIRRGDWLAITGHPYLTDTGQMSVLASVLPQTIAVSLQPVPESISDKAFVSRNRHVERIVDSSAIEVLILRHRIIHSLRNYFIDRDFVEVNTPLLTKGAGGAIARPFETKATELGDTNLNLRIAPELFLKRLIVGNMDRVFEIGPAFRNEGVDSTHNPEFTICEFYQTMADVEQLIAVSEDLLRELENVTDLLHHQYKSIPDPGSMMLAAPYPRISFIPAIETAIRTRIPNYKCADYNDPAASQPLQAAMKEFGIPLPQDPPSVPRLLDMLSFSLIESKIQEPTWIIHHPECMSPLAKSFTPSRSPHAISARAELFIRGQEYINCYEEENSPIEQRRKFEAQLRTRDPETPAVIDESYLKALEWGMPPTGGWGCGIDRLVMLFAGKKRIADVLPFGTLTNVVALGSQGS